MRNNLFALCTAVLTVMSVAPSAGADAANHFKVNEQVPLTGFRASVPCTGDTITFTQGTLHDLFQLTVNGSHFSMTTHDQPHNLKGTDSSGRTYEGVGITRESDSGSFVNDRAVITFVNNFNMVGKAGAPTYKAHETFHVTASPSGHITVSHDRLRITCR